MFDSSADLSRGTVKPLRIRELYMVHLGEVKAIQSSILDAVHQECRRRVVAPRVFTFSLAPEWGPKPKLVWGSQPDKKWFLASSCAINIEQPLFAPSRPEEVEFSLACIERIDQEIYECLGDLRTHRILESILVDPAHLSLQRVLVLLLAVYGSYPKEITDRLRCREVLNRLDQIWRLG